MINHETSSLQKVQLYLYVHLFLRYRKNQEQERQAQDFTFKNFNEYIPGYTLYQIKKCSIPGSEKMFHTKLEAQLVFPGSFWLPKKR